MRRLSIAVVCLAWLPLAAQAQESLSPSLVTAVKAATVFVKIKSPEIAGSGSGFVVETNGDTAYIVTNRHVVEPKAAEIVIERRPTRPVELAGQHGAASQIPARPTPRLARPTPRGRYAQLLVHAADCRSRV